MKKYLFLVSFFITFVALSADKDFESEIIEWLVRLETKGDNYATEIIKAKRDLQKQTNDFKSGTHSFEYWAFGIIISI